MFRFSRPTMPALGLLLCAGVLPIVANGAQALTVYTWSEYMDPDVVSEFEVEFDADVRFSYFGSDELRDRELTARGGAGFDVMMVNSAQMSSYVRRGWIGRVDETVAPNLVHIDPRWAAASGDKAAGHGVAYFWGTLGIAWRGDLYPPGVTSWKTLLEPDPALSGRIVMSDYGRELVGFALKADGFSVNTTDRDRIRAAGERLVRQKPHVKAYGYPALTGESSLLKGEVWAAPMYSGDALMLKEANPDIEYRIPEEGGLLWVDYLTVSRTSLNAPLAHAFIDFLNRPEVAARNAEYVHYATPNVAAREFVSDEYLADPVIHPSRRTIAGLELITALPARSTKSINTVVSELFAD